MTHLTKEEHDQILTLTRSYGIHDSHIAFGVLTQSGPYASHDARISMPPDKLIILGAAITKIIHNSQAFKDWAYNDYLTKTQAALNKTP